MARRHVRHEVEELGLEHSKKHNLRDKDNLKKNVSQQVQNVINVDLHDVIESNVVEKQDSSVQEDISVITNNDTVDSAVEKQKVDVQEVSQKIENKRQKVKKNYNNL